MINPFRKNAKEPEEAEPDSFKSPPKTWRDAPTTGYLRYYLSASIVEDRIRRIVPSYIDVVSITDGEQDCEVVLRSPDGEFTINIDPGYLDDSSFFMLSDLLTDTIKRHYPTSHRYG